MKTEEAYRRIGEAVVKTGIRKDCFSDEVSVSVFLYPYSDGVAFCVESAFQPTVVWSVAELKAVEDAALYVENRKEEERPRK